MNYNFKLLLFIFCKQKKPKPFITVIHCTCFLLFGFYTHAKEIQKITTPHFSILFNKSATNLAERIANTLEMIYKPVSKTLGIYPSPMHVVINNQSTKLNGLFKAMPRHIYLYTLHHSNPYFVANMDWLNILSIHEFRHAVQHSIEYHSTPFWLRPLYFGGNLISVCGVSSFFKEGDAVGIETALSEGGRGRLPGWEKVYKVNLLEGNTVSFSRQLFGSLKYEIPSEYHIGYYFTTHIRRKYGTNAIQSIFEKNIRGIPFFGFYSAIKKVTKKSILKVYKDMNQELFLSWQKQLEGLKITPATQLTIKNPNDSFHYIQPFIDASGNLMAWKEGINVRNQLVQVRLDPSHPIASKNIFPSFRKDKTLLYFIKDSLPPAAFAIGQGCAAWLEMCRHPWQGDKQTICLQYYDFKQRQRRTLVASSRYTALAMSPNTRQLVAVTSDETGKHFLVILETKSGKVVKKIDNPDNDYYLTPSWSGEDHIIVIKTKDQQNSIVQINVATSKAEILLPYTYEHRSYPKVYKDYLLYNSSYNGIDNIYAMHLPTKACFQVTSRKYGAYLGMVNPINNQLVFNDYTKNGMDIAVMPFDPLLWTPLGEVEDRSVRYYEPLVVQEQNGDILAKVTNHLYPLSKYHFAKDSLAFIGANVELNWNDRGIKIEPLTLVNLEDSLKVTPYFYQNFNTSSRNKYIRYKTSELGLKASYTTCYPILEIDIRSTRYKGYKKPEMHCLNYKSGSISDPSWSTLYFCLNKSKILWIPTLDFKIKFPYYFSLDSSSGEAYLEAEMHLIQPDKDKKIDHVETYTFNIQNSSTKSKRDLHPPWIQELNMTFKNAKKNPNLSKGHENIFYLNAKFYIPGIRNHHYFSLSPSIQRFKKTAKKPYWKPYINVMYGFPLVYPECGIPLIWFLEKIWIEGYYTTKARKINQIGNTAYTTLDNNQDPTLDTIGAQLCFSSRLLINKTIPRVNVFINFNLFKKRNNNWKFQSLLPKFNLALQF